MGDALCHFKVISGKDGIPALSPFELRLGHLALYLIILL